MREPEEPVALSKIVFITAVCAITCVLVVGVTYLSPSNALQTAGNQGMETQKVEGSMDSTPAHGPSVTPTFKGKMKATAPWQHGDRK